LRKEDAMRRILWHVAAVAALAAPWLSAVGAGADEAPANKEALRYDGKSFDYWKSYVTTELKAERLIDAIHAMRAFGLRGYTRPAAETLVGVVKDHWRESEQGIGADDPENKVIEEVLLAVARLGPPAMEVLLQHQESAEVREFTTRVVLRFGKTIPYSPAAVQTLVRAAEGNDARLRRFAVGMLGSAIDQPAVTEALTGSQAEGIARALAALLGEKDVDVSDAFALIAFMGPRAKAALPALVSYRLREKFWFWDDSSAKLGRVADLLTPLVARGLKDGQPEVRYRAARWLGELGQGARGAVPALLETLKDSSPPVRFQAIRSLGRIAAEPEKAIPALRQVFSDRREFREHRAEAALALMSFGPQAKESLPALLKTIAGGEEEEGRPIGEVKGWAEEWAVPTSPADEKESEYAARVSGAVFLTSATSGWAPEGEKESKNSVRRAAIRAAVRIGEPGQVAPALREAAKDPALRKAALAAIEKITGKAEK
jgi:HEAT repeat protein